MRAQPGTKRSARHGLRHSKHPSTRLETQPAPCKPGIEPPTHTPEPGQQPRRPGQKSMSAHASTCHDGPHSAPRENKGHQTGPPQAGRAPHSTHANTGQPPQNQNRSKGSPTRGHAIGPPAPRRDKSRESTRADRGTRPRSGPAPQLSDSGTALPAGPPPPRSRAAGRQAPLAKASTSTHGTLFMRADAAPDQEHEVLVRTTPSLGTFRR